MNPTSLLNMPVFSPTGTPNSKSEADRMAVLYALVSMSGHFGISRRALMRALLWLEKPELAKAGLSEAAFAFFVSAVTQWGSVGASDVDNLIRCFDTFRLASVDSCDGMVRRVVTSPVPEWLPYRDEFVVFVAVLLLDPLTREPCAVQQ